MIKERLYSAKEPKEGNKDSLEKFADRVKNGVEKKVIVRGDFRVVYDSKTRFLITYASGQEDVFSEVYKESFGVHKKSERKTLSLLVTIDDRMSYLKGKLAPDVIIIGQVNGSDIMTDPDRYKEMLSKAKEKGIKPLGKQLNLTSPLPPDEKKLQKKAAPKKTVEFQGFIAESATKERPVREKREDVIDKQPDSVTRLSEKELQNIPIQLFMDKNIVDRSFVGFLILATKSKVENIIFDPYYRKKDGDSKEPIAYIEYGTKIQIQTKEGDKNIFLQPHGEFSEKMFNVLNNNDRELIELKLLATSDHYSRAIEEGLHIRTKGPLDNLDKETKQRRTDIRNNKIIPFPLPSLD